MAFRRPVRRTSFTILAAVTVATLGCRSAEPFSSQNGFRLGTDDDASAGADSGQTEASTGGAGGVLGGSGGNPGSGGAAATGSGGDSGTGGSVVASSSGGAGGASADAAADAATDAGADSPDAPLEAGPNHCQHGTWTATASAAAPEAPIPNGIDGDITTRWGNGRLQDGTDWYQVNFGGTIQIDAIAMDNSMTYPGDFPGAYAIYGSLDGVTFTGPFVTGNGASNITAAKFATQTVRAIRINQTGTSRHTNWWQIGELKITCVP